MGSLMLADRQVFDRFADAVDVDDVTGCWNWTGRLFDNGYSLFASKRPDGHWRPRYGHRIAYELFVGPIPDGLVLDHTCVNKICVCPEHLDAVTQTENRRRQAVRQTVCRRGHPLSGDNLYSYARPGGVTRHCRACRRLADRRHDQRKREAMA